MPTWSEILTEIEASTEQYGISAFDRVRRRYLLDLHHYTGRNVILYASGWIQKPETPAASMSIDDEDITAFMEVTSGLSGPNLDLILHSPGGFPEAAEGIVCYLRTRFSHIRVIVPQLAMSAATMISCAADEIVMGNHSFLGPTDPQVLLDTPLGVRLVPAQSVLDQFDRAQQECLDPTKLSAWLPMLNQYGPDLLIRCETALNLSRELVKIWLRTYMFRNEIDGWSKAERISDWLADHKTFKSHSRHISRRWLLNHQLKVMALEPDYVLQDLALSVFHAAIQAFAVTPTVKIVENQIGRAFIKQYTPPPQPVQADLGIGSDQQA